MHKFLRKIVQILDGTPAEYGIRPRGQSMVELALVTPILIVLIMGLVEIGWFANNYLILLEATRTGARFGTVQTGSNSPLAWNPDGSLVANAYNPSFFPLDPDTEIQRIGVRNCNLVTDPQYPEFQGFYSLLFCTVEKAMDPLQLHSPRIDNDDPTKNVFYPDDVIISVFALQLIDPRIPFWGGYDFDASKKNSDLLATIPGIDADMPRVLVVGRYPTNANECTVNNAGVGAAIEDRDPFDYIKNGKRDYVLSDPGLLPDPTIEDNRVYLELSGMDDATPFEQQRGFAVYGQHHIAGPTGPNANCLGSEWTIAEVEHLINLPNFDLKDAAQRSKLASMGMVLVELFWQHELLLKNPVFNPVFTMIGDDNTTVYVWAAFPVPAAEPRIRFE